MFELIDQINGLVPVYMLVFSRLSAMLITMPVFGFASVSVRIRIVLGVLLTFVITPLLGASYTVAYGSVIVLMMDILREIMIGLMLGYGARIVFEGFSIAGQFVGMQMGMAIMAVFDPSSEDQQPVVGNFWLMVIIIMFLITNSHHFLIQILFYNFKIIGLGSAAFKPAVGQSLVHSGTLMFDLALKFGAPAMIFLLSVDLAISFMARVMPQLNIFFISLPLKIGAGIFLLMISLQIFQSLFSYIIDNLQSFVIEIVQGI